MNNFLTWARGLLIDVVILPVMFLLLFMVALPAIMLISTLVSFIWAVFCPREALNHYKNRKLFD